MPERWIDEVAAILGGVPARAVVINLDRRVDRWDRFVAGCPILDSVERFAAIDGSRVTVPSVSKIPAGAWGCLQSHLMIWRRALVEGYHRDGGVLVVFEDDAVFADGFREQSLDLIARTRRGWDMIYLGGQHTHGQERRPIRVEPGIHQAYSVNRTQAYVIRGKAIATAYMHCNDLGLIAGVPKRHIDHRLEELHRSGAFAVYSPERWLVGQGAGKSDISPRGRPDPERWWHPDVQR